MTKYFIGLDLGQSQDYSALAILERVKQTKTITMPAVTVRGRYYPGGEAQEEIVPRYECNHLERFPLGTRYPAIVETMREMLHRPELRGQSGLVIDATGVGRPVCDMFRQAGLDYTGVSITGGDAVTYGDGLARVPKRILVSTLQVVLQSERLKVAPNPLREVLVSEMLAFQVTISEAANDTYGGRTGAHDDLVLAVALAAWRGENWHEVEPIPSTSSHRWFR